ncbi:MAG: Asp23/Gls24 family envelope stress response protein [Ruminococcaceae bacterium]|nr:Asp23/Gls24 family envelope stress response protein [Oscillospiraceae bacterium]
MVRIENTKGNISITEEVFTNLAGDAATQCFGVKAMAGRSKDGGVFQLKRESMSKGVTAKLNEDGSVSIQLHIAVNHGVNVLTLGNSIINEVSYKVSNATGVPVKSVDVYIDTMLIG